MRTSTPLWLLGALGALSLTVADPAAAADPSQWTCEKCPYEKPSRQASVELGVGAVSDDAARFGDYTGLDREGFALVGATLRHRYGDGGYADVDARDLGLDTRSLAAEGGHAGRYALRFGYAEIPHRLTDTARTPFAGNGSGFLTLPAGYPAATTAEMPLAATLQPLELGTKRKRADAGGTLQGPAGWTWRVDARHDEREGTLRGGGSFFSNASQLALPVDHVTDQVEVSAAYTDTRLHASLAYHASSFRNHDDALTWQNPFTSPVPGATAGQLALPPDNQFHQVRANAGYQVSPKVRASAELAFGRMLQDQPFLAATLNPFLAVPALPAASLQGRADTLDASVRVSVAATETLRLAASATRNERDNRTPSLAFPTVSTDMFLGAATRASLPYSFTRDRVRLGADWRGPKTLLLAGGVDHDTVERTLQEAGRTRETTVWTRATARPIDTLTVALKLAHAQREVSSYVPVAAIQPPENPLLRKFNMADRRRQTVGLRADTTLGEKVGLGVTLDVSADNYRHSPVGLTDARSAGFGADLSMPVSAQTQLRAYLNSEHVRSTQRGSQGFAQPDWTGRVRDTFDVVGVGVTHSALKGKLELTGDATVSRSRSRDIVRTGATPSAFPRQTTELDGLKLTATWHYKANLSLLGGWAWERYVAEDWRLDGVAPGTVANLLAFGEQPATYHVNVVRVGVRYRF